MHRLNGVTIVGGTGRGVCRLLHAPVPPAVSAAPFLGTPAEQLLALLGPETEEQPGNIAFAVARMRRDILLEAAQRAETGEFAAAREAVAGVCAELEAALGRARSRQLAARAEDVRDIAEVLDGALRSPHGDRPAWKPGAVLVGERMTVLEALEAARAGVAGVILQKYQPLSHAAIVLAGAGIPVAYGMTSLEPFSEGMRLCIDGGQGCVLLEPEEEHRPLGGAARGPEAPRERVLLPDGSSCLIRLNSLGSFERLPPGASVGLLRTEFFYASLGRLPTEQELAAEYAALAGQCQLTTIRLLDVGDDKPIPGLETPPVANPALGMRGVRLLLTHPAVLERQVRAILRASAAGKVRVLVPMVTSPVEVWRVREILDRCMQALATEGRDFDPGIPLGAMIETPAAAILADGFAAVSDFAAIGTNDLTQYVMAAERGAPEMKPYLEEGCEAVLRLTRGVQAAFAAAGKPVCVCGEMAASPEGIHGLLRAGIREFSVGAGFAGAVAKAVRTAPAGAFAGEKTARKTL